MDVNVHEIIVLRDKKVQARTHKKKRDLTSRCNTTVTFYRDHGWYCNPSDREKYYHSYEEEPDLLYRSR